VFSVWWIIGWWAGPETYTVLLDCCWLDKKYLPARSDSGTNKIGGRQQARNILKKKNQYFHEIFSCKIRPRNQQERG
jgi:hypothetical protein